ncbi:MAG: hypothetical protein JXR97_07280 [Planctomycetes bacterium]|nr:hypothetical protein [Planctomycetota bacterium]
MISSGLSSILSSSGISAYSSQLSSYSEDMFSASSCCNSTDEVSLSDLALNRYEIMKIIDGSDVLFNQLTSSGETRKTKTLEEVGQDLQEDLAGFQDFFAPVLSALQDSLGAESLTMRLDGKGHVLMGTDSEDVNMRTELGDNETFAARFAVIAARSAILDAAANEPGFEQDYKEDAVGAIKKHIDALADRLFGYRMTTEDGIIQDDSAEE